MLDRQIQVMSLDTGNFYSNKEMHMHWLNHKLRLERNQLINGGVIKSSGKAKRIVVGLKQIENKFFQFGIDKKELELIYKKEYDFSLNRNENTEDLIELADTYCHLKDLVTRKTQLIKKSKNALLTLLSNKTESNIKSNGKHHVRELCENQVSTKNIISVFESSFTRMIGAKPNELCEDFMVIQVYYFSIIEDLIYHGFMYKGEKYIYFTSSAGQIRTKKVVFVKESVWKKHEKTIMCGLTLDEINKKGGNNPNKYLAYMALANSATDVWEEFDIDKTIVIDDFETDVPGLYDLVDDADYSIKRISGSIPINHTDGAGMMLPSMGKNRMIRLPWIKGLLGVFDFVKFIQVNGCSPVIKDIYGKEHNILEEDIQIILTKSQFKLNKHYDSWDEYKTYFKQYGCTAGYANIEEDRIKDASINYQMLQTLTDVTDEEIDSIIKRSNDKLENLCSSVESMKNALGITPYNQHLTPLQRAINLYPNLMNDEYIKITLRDIKNSMVKRYRAGSLSVNGKYTFLLPDFYAACEYWFMGIKEPEGLLHDGEVFCWLFRKNERLDCLRSPHLDFAHAIRRNVAWNKCDQREGLREWFCTDAIYTSCHDLISKILQFDVDGDMALVVADQTIIKVAERNLKQFDIVPLYYNMKSAHSVYLNSKTIYEGLKAAFVGGNIGIYSNNISKIWNSDVFVSGTDDEKKEAVDIIKILCMENNHVIDFAKTLYKPTRPKYIHKKILNFTKSNVPHFFVYAKDKEERQVEPINSSFVNQLNVKIKNPRINCRNLGLRKIDYRLLVNDPDIKCRVKFSKSGKLDVNATDPMIVKYCELNQKYHFKINAECADLLRAGLLNNTQLKQHLFFKNIAREIKDELSQFGYSDCEITDILVKFLYYIKPSKHKDVLWFCYGEYILNNIESKCKPKNKIIQCVDCGEWFEVAVKNNKTCRCSECLMERERELTRLRVQKYREGLN